MYGMVNEGVRDFIEKNHGPETWAKICDKAGVGVTQFDRMSAYDDAHTYNLVGAVSEVAGLPAEQVLEVFGKFWVEFAGATSFGSLMQLAGDTFVDRVRGLDEMHERILLSMPHLSPPSFELDDAGEKTYTLRYYSDRPGLAPMVIGLLHGLAEDTGEKIEVRHVTPKSDQSDHDVFEIRLLA